MVIRQQPWFKGLGVGLAILLGALILTLLMITQVNLERIYLTGWLKTLWLISMLISGFLSGWWSEARGWLSGLWAGMAFSAIIGLFLLPFGYPLTDISFYLSVVFWSGMISAMGGSWGINQRVWQRSKHFHRRRPNYFS